MRRPAAAIALVAILVATLGGGLSAWSRRDAGPAGVPDLDPILLQRVADADGTQAVHLAQGDVDAHPLIDFALDALVSPERYSNVTRSGNVVEVWVERTQGFLVLTFLNERRTAEHGRGDWVEGILEVSFCGETRSGGFCGHSYWDFQAAP